MSAFERLPDGAKDLNDDGLSIMLNNLRELPLQYQQQQILKQATVEDVCLTLVEEEPENGDIQYHAEMSVCIETCVDAMTGEQLEEALEAPRVRAEDHVEICANLKESHRLLLLLPPLYRAAVAGILVRQSLKNVKFLAKKGARIGAVENPNDYIRIRKKALVRFYRLLNDKEGSCT